MNNVTAPSRFLLFKKTFFINAKRAENNFLLKFNSILNFEGLFFFLQKSQVRSCDTLNYFSRPESSEASKYDLAH